MTVKENSSVSVVSAARLAGVEVDATTATGNLDIFPGDANAPVYVLTNDLSGGVVVGINTRNARRGDRARVVRNSATPGAVTVTVKSGTAAGGSTLGRAIAASRNGWVEAVFDGSAWICAGIAEYT